MNTELVGGRDFLKRYFRDCGGGNIELRALHIVKNAPSEVVHQKAYSDIDALLADAEKLSKRYNVFFNTVALNGGFTEDHAVACPALRIDIDFKNGITEAEALEMLAAFPLPPSAIIRTGGGLHVYWFLAELAGREDFPRVKAIIKSLAFTLRADTGACDIPRIFRLPGSVNRKPDYNPPRPVTLARADWHPEREYSLSDFAALLPIEGEIKLPPAEKMKMAEAAGAKLPIERLADVYDKCTELDGMRRNAIEGGRLLPEDKPGEHLARIRMMNLYRAFDGGPERAVQEIFSHLDDFNANETAKQAASLNGAPPPCVELCPAGQCDEIKTLGKRSPIAFAYPTRTAPAVPTTEAAPLEKFRATDLWNARLFVHLHGDKVRYCERLGGWHFFNGKRWARADCGEIQRLSKDVPRHILKLAYEEPDEERRKVKTKHAAVTEAAGKLAAILELAKTEEGIAVAPEVFDARPWLFNVANGTLDLISGELLPHRPEDMLTNISPAEWRELDAK